MKAWCALAACLHCLSGAAWASTWEDVYEGLLKKYADESGVRYAAWHANAEDRQALEGVAHAIAHKDLSSLSRDETLAFYLNAYNAWILKTVLDHYPLKSIKDAMLFVFKRDILTVAGKKMSFSALENDVIRTQFKDARIHFALNCASEGCPPLHDRAFRAKDLEETLTKLTQQFVRKNPLGVAVKDGGREVHLSKIFDWYREDFERESDSLLDYVNRYREKAVSREAKLRFQDYDWSLNEAE